jgi:hypothetical protein
MNFTPELSHHDKIADINLVYLTWKYAEKPLFLKLLSAIQFCGK